ncbi:MAG: hypothetical protein IBJ18_00485 [Phycisphaerales bacterium]|nr:hypothetical protein [Phycisphaerales bacterium]
MKTSQYRVGLGRAIVATVLTVCLSAGLSGCKSQGGADSGASSAKSAIPRAADGSIVAVNAMCPAMPEHPVKKKLDESVVRVYKGKVVGFCCSDCPEQWDAMSDADREKALAAAMKPAGK